MKLNDFISRIEQRLPKKWAESWDNPGLAVGDYESEINKIAVALDATAKNISCAHKLGADLLVTHHPLILHPVKNVINGTHVGSAIFEAIKCGVNIYAAHTNWDWAPNGVNFTLASLIGLEKIKPLVQSDTGSWGIAAYGYLPESLTLAQFAHLVQKKLRLNNFTFYGEPERKIRKIAIGGGACMDFWPDAARICCDCFITADVKYHMRQEALERGLAIIAADHGEMERASLPALCKVIEEETKLPVILLEEQDPFFEHGEKIL